MPDRAQASSLASWRFDVATCRADLDEFERLLVTRAELSERGDIIPFFHAHPNLSAFLGSYHPNINTYDRLGVEVPLFGAFMADILAGDWEKRAYCFIEFEDGKSNSIFVRRSRQTSDWSTRFDRGFDQLVDWLWLLDDQEHTMAFESLFGTRQIDVVALLVIGRDSGVSTADRRRLVWRRNHVVVNSHHVYCCTFDELLRDLRQRLRTFTSETRAE